MNTPYRVTSSRKSLIDAGLYGSTLLSIRWPFTLVTLGIEFHHIHHASVLVPSYHLARCHEEGERLRLFDGINRVGGYRAVMSLFHALFKGNIKVRRRSLGLQRRGGGERCITDPLIDL